MQFIKLIWDFRGPDALQIATHHETHLKEYISLTQLEANNTGINQISDLHSIAYMIVKKADMILVRDALKPHRGQVYTN